MGGKLAAKIKASVKKGKKAVAKKGKKAAKKVAKKGKKVAKKGKKAAKKVAKKGKKRPVLKAKVAVRKTFEQCAKEAKIPKAVAECKNWKNGSVPDKACIIAINKSDSFGNRMRWMPALKKCMNNNENLPKK